MEPEGIHPRAPGVDQMSKFDPGVYLWTNIVTKKVYVGSTRCVRRRKAEHILRLNKGAGGSDYLQRAWNKYGAKKFTFEILERCSAEDLLKREQYWIDRLKATDERYGYNLIPTRESQLYGAALSKHQKKGWAKYSADERKQLNLHLNKPEAKLIALAKSNEVKKLQPWRDAMAPTWSKLQKKWEDPIQAAKIVAAQNEGRKRAKRRRQRPKLIGEEIVRPTVK